MAQIKEGVKFYDPYSGVHTITKLENNYDGFLHTYMDNKRTVEGFMYSKVFVKFVNEGIVILL